MKILIVAGGTGSIALQTGLHSVLAQSAASDVIIKVLVNAYDNGLSTGAVRKVLGGQILGPSDVRKNQTTRYGLVNGRGTRTPFDFLDLRFTAPSSDAERYVLACLDKANLDREIDSTLSNAIKAFFSAPLATRIDYTDFSAANIIYAGLALQNGNSLRAAAKIMAHALQIGDDVILNDDTSLFLGAITKSGNRITDEGDIVSWNNSSDPIVDVFFTTPEGEERNPVLCDEAKEAIKTADVIILSSGTQWSSLIPTYASDGFMSAIKNTSAKVLMVMNRVPDKDAPGQGADDIINTLIPKYLPEGKIDLIVDNSSDEMMRSVRTETVAKLKSINSFDMGFGGNGSRHHPQKLAIAVCKTIYRDFIDAKAFMFDYDDTLVGRGNSFAAASNYNRSALKILNEKNPNVAICTGNSIKAINFDRVSPLPEFSSNLRIYADGGINRYEYNTNTWTAGMDEDDERRPYTFVECLVPAAQFAKSGTKSAQGIISALRLVGIPTAKVENRGDVMMTIKPVDPEYREIVRNLALRVLENTGLRVKSAGRTTIEIASPLVTKAAAVKEMLSRIGEDDTLVYVGDEFENGNDAAVIELAKFDKRIRCLRVNNPVNTAMFFTALNLNSSVHY